MNNFFPVSIKLKGHRVVVIGAGRVAERKIRSLRSFGADISVVAPKATRYLKGLSQEGRIRLFERKYRSGDIAKARLVIAATADRATNEKVGRDARKSGIWVNVVDHTSQCDFIAPAIIKRRGLVIAISTDGKKPVLSKKFKDFLKGKIDEFRSSGDQL